MELLEGLQSGAAAGFNLELLEAPFWASEVAGNSWKGCYALPFLQRSSTVSARIICISSS